MKRISRYLMLFVVCSCFFAPLHSAFASAEWHKGTVTAVLRSTKYRSIEVDKIKYRIYKRAKIKNVYTKNDALYKDYIDIASIKRGDTLYIQVKGRWIYQIEKVQ